MVTNEENKNNESNKNIIRDDLDNIQAVKKEMYNQIIKKWIKKARKMENANANTRNK